MDRLTLDATIENVETVTEFVDARLEEAGCSMKAEMQINIAIDELFSNIAKYAYGAPGAGEAEVTLDISGDPAVAEITFIDGGVPYDPLAMEDPDITASVDERPVGGLGILIVKKTMDGVTYRNTDGRNILTIRKIIAPVK